MPDQCQPTKSIFRVDSPFYDASILQPAFNSADAQKLFDQAAATAGVGTINYVGLEPVSYSSSGGTLTFTLTSGNDDIAVSVNGSNEIVLSGSTVRDLEGRVRLGAITFTSDTVTCPLVRSVDPADIERRAAFGRP